MTIENLVRFRFDRDTVKNLETEFNNFVDLEKVNKNDSNVTAQKRLSEIELILAKANTLFYQKKYQEALKEYKYVQGLLHQLIDPSIPPKTFIHPKLDLVINQSLFTPLLASSLSLLDSMTPKGMENSFSSEFVDIPPEVIESTAKFSQLGIKVSDQLPTEISQALNQGLEYAGRKEWDKAEFFFLIAFRGLDNATTPEMKLAKASAELNLGSVLAQKSKFDQAQNFLNRAAVEFQNANDVAGEAQVAFNLAATLNKAGNEQEAKNVFNRAVALTKRAENVTDLNSTLPIVTPVSISAASIIGILVNKEGYAMTLRTPGKGTQGWTVQDLESNIDTNQTPMSKEVSILNGENIFKVAWNKGELIDTTHIANELYRNRISSKNLEEILYRYDFKSDLSVKIPHLYFCHLLVCIGDCYHHLGEYQKALAEYKKASQYAFLNNEFELPSLWIKIARNYLLWGDSFYKNEEAQDALEIYSNVITPDDTALPFSPLYSGKLDLIGTKVKDILVDIDNAENSSLNPTILEIVLDVRRQLLKIAAGLDFSGFPANYIPIFRFDFLQSVAQYFAQQAIQAERQYIDFTTRGENEVMTRQQLQDSVELSVSEVALSNKEVEYTQAELMVTQENADLAALRINNATQAKEEYANVSYEVAALDSASVFASGPEGYSVSYTYYSPSEGKNVTLSGSDAYKVMEEAAWRRGMLTRDLELNNMERNINELEQSKVIADAQKKAAEKRMQIAEQQRKISILRKKQSEELLTSFESELFTPEVWFQLANNIKYISDVYLNRAIAVAKMMQKAYEFETGESLKIIKNSYTTNILSGLLSADYLLKDIDYFTIHLIQSSKSKDIPIKQTFSLNELNPTAFATTFKQTGKIEFETNFADFDRWYPGSYLRKIKKVDVLIEGLIPPTGVTGTLRNSGISKDRKENGEEFFRVQPQETMFISSYNVKQDFAIFPPDAKTLGVFENSGIATSWILDIPSSSNNVNFDTISDIKLIFYYSSRYNSLLEKQIKPTLPTNGENSFALPFRLLFPDEFFGFLDTGELNFSLFTYDLAYNEKNHVVKNLAIKIITEPGVSAKDIIIEIIHDKENANISAKTSTNDEGIVKSNIDEGTTNPLNGFIGKPLTTTSWIIKINEQENIGFNRNKIKDMFLFAEYTFEYR